MMKCHLVEQMNNSVFKNTYFYIYTCVLLTLPPPNIGVAFFTHDRNKNQGEIEMDIELETYVEQIMNAQKVTNGIKLFSWLDIFKRNQS